MELERQISEDNLNVSAGLLVIYNNSVLMVSQKNISNRRFKYSIPKGHLETNETPLNAAIRETFEETGIRVPIQYINTQPHILNINTASYKRRIIYFITKLPTDIRLTKVSEFDNSEISWSGFITVDLFQTLIQPFQIPLVIHLYNNYIPNHILSEMEKDGYIKSAHHPQAKLKIYNYTAKCKKYEYWNEVTMWCRGLITDENGHILYRPLKKFFEFKQLYKYFKPESKNFKIYDKIDGFLGIMYWINGLPFIATRGSFISFPAIRATSILYKKYFSVVRYLNPIYTYIFEIVFPNNLLIIDYGDIEDLYLIGIYDNEKNIDIPLEEIEAPFPKSKACESKDYSLEELFSLDIINKEGFVIRYPDGQRLKIKFPSYKQLYEKKNHK